MSEFITQVRVSQAPPSQSALQMEQLLTELRSINQTKRRRIQIAETYKPQLKQNKEQSLKKDEIDNEIEVTQQLKKQEDILLNQISLTNHNIDELRYQIKLHDCYVGDIQGDEREIKQLAIMQQNSYINFRSFMKNERQSVEYQKIQIAKKILEQQLQQTQSDYYENIKKIKEATKVIQNQNEIISDLNYQNQLTQNKLFEQKQVVVQLQILSKLERYQYNYCASMFLNFDETISDNITLENFKEDQIYRMIIDFMDNHPFGVKYLVDSLIQVYRKQQIQLDSEIEKATELMEYKKECIQELKDIEQEKNAYRNINELEQDLNFRDLIQIQANHSLMLAQNQFKISLISKAESFIIKAFSNLFLSVCRFNDMVQIIHSRRQVVDQKLIQIENRFKSYCLNHNLNSLTLSLMQFKQLLQLPENSQQLQEIYKKVNQSVMLKLYVTEEVLISYIQTGMTFLQLFTQATDYYREQINQMIGLIQSISRIQRRSRHSLVDIPSSAKISLRLEQPSIKRISNFKTETESNTQKIMSNKTKTTKRHSFASTHGLSNKQIEYNEDQYIEMERQKILNPQSTKSLHSKPLNEQQIYCNMLSGTPRGISNRNIFQSLKGLKKYRIR